MTTRLAFLTSAILGFTIGLDVRAQDKDKGNDGKGAGAGHGAAAQPKTIHGVVAGVTVEGELAVDYKTNRAASAEMTFLTIVGMPVGEGEKGHHEGTAGGTARDEHEKGAAAGARHHHVRHNVYVVWVSPKTKVCMAKASGGANGTPADAKLDDLEIGDHVEVVFNARDLERHAAGKHGRHRTYFGDASSITILSEPAHDSEHDKGKDTHKEDK